MKTLVAVFCFNEGDKLRNTLAQFPGRDQRDYDVIVMNDGSTDDSRHHMVELGFDVLDHAVNKGAGAAIKTVYRHALEQKYEVIVLIAGNGKMRPAEIPRLLAPIAAGEFDYVQGSRYLDEGKSANMPLFRRVSIPIITKVVAVVTGFKGTDVTCGFRAYKLEIIQHPEVDVWQEWLDKYEMEYYVHYKAIKLGYRVCERPVSMIYPPEGKNYSKIKAFSGWWSMLRPWLFLWLGIKK
jgi:dolichol-phosphate mannosyltransferase